MLSGLTDLARKAEPGNVVAVKANPEDPGLPQTVDLVFLANAYHHLPDRPTYFARLAPYLKPSGRVALIEARPTGLRRLVGHATSRETIRLELEAAAYTMAADLDFLPRQSFLIFKQRRAFRDD
jgi:hypothetical protein